MPKNQFERMLFAFITVVITVHAYVFFSLYVVNGSYFLSVDGANGSVIGGINAQGGVGAFGTYLPIWAIVLIEFAFAYTLECIMGQPLSFKLASKVFNPQTHPVLFECAVISATVALMCPAMSLIAAAIYYPYYAGFNFWTFTANWLKLVCFNFPFAFFTQTFFIQPFVRMFFKLITRRKRKKEI